jgi:hypothetical protein
MRKEKHLKKNLQEVFAMKKENFVTLVMSTVGGLIFALGMCMALLPQWNAFTQGVVCIAVGIVVLLAMAIVRRKMVGAPKIKVNAKTVGTVIYGVFSALVFGVGMCMTMVWSGLMVWGIVVGIVGIALLLGLIPMIKGIK